MRALEERLGVALVVRTTRTVRLTAEGRVYLDHARAGLTSVQAADDAATSFNARASGTLRVTVAPPLACPLLAEVVPRYMLRYPAVSIIVDSSIDNVDLSRREVDVAIRIGPLRDSSLICRRLGAIGGGYYASPSYLARRGAPRTPADLALHDTIAIPRAEQAPSWRFAKGGRAQTVVVRPRVLVAAAVHRGRL